MRDKELMCILDDHKLNKYSLNELFAKMFAIVDKNSTSNKEWTDQIIELKYTLMEAHKKVISLFFKGPGHPVMGSGDRIPKQDILENLYLHKNAAYLGLLELVEFYG